MFLSEITQHMKIVSLKQKYGATALVAGASEGMGAAYANYLATEGMNLILIARRKEPLEKLAAKLRDQYHIEVDCLNIDLSAFDATVQIKEAVHGKEINLLVYNAGLSYIGPFEKNSLEHHNLIARTNMITPLNMVYTFGELMVKNGKGAIILMASLAGSQGSGFLSTYAATKAFNRILGESLWYEWKNRGVDVIACIAGATTTPNFLNTKPAKTGLISAPLQSPEQVVNECFRYLGKRPSIITGRSNRLASFFMEKILPRKTTINMMGDTTRKMYGLS